jgi:DNA replication protein DnaC
MRKEEIKVATATLTPLYLPLYVAENYQFFELQTKYSVKIVQPPEKGQSGDRWAIQELVDQRASFAVCDPIMAEEYRDPCVIAAVINRAAFWSVSRGPEIRRISDFRKFTTIVTYPPGMTANRIAKAIAACLHGKRKIKRARIDSELNHLLKYPDDVAITANLAYAKQFVDQNRSFRISALWFLHPSLYNYLLTGLLTQRSAAVAKFDLVTGLVRAVHRAMAIVRTDERTAARVLQNKYKENGIPLDENTSIEIVDQFNRHRIYPTTPFADLTSWHNARMVERYKTFTLAPAHKALDQLDKHSDAYDQYVLSTSAHTVETESLKLLILYSQAELNYEIINTLSALSHISLEDVRVVGNYCRYEEKVRNSLKEWVTRIVTALQKSTTVRENFLIWGGSGSGKSYLIQELAGSLDKAIKFQEENLAKLTKAEFLSDLKSVENLAGPVLYFIDEIACENAVEWGYDALYPHLDLRILSKRPVVFVMAGSYGQSVRELSDFIESCKNQGSDVKSRIPADRRFEIPSALVEDRAAVVASQVHANTKVTNKKIEQIEKLALYYLLSNTELGKPRQLRDMAIDALSRVTKDEHYLKYDHLFDKSNRETRQRFWAEHMAAVAVLANSYVKI